MTQYAVLSAYVCISKRLTGRELVHVIADAHIYDRHGVPIVKEMIEKTPYDAPQFIMGPKFMIFTVFTKDSFRLEGLSVPCVYG